MFRSKYRRLIGFMLSFMLIFSSVQPTFAANTSSFNDLSGNWAEQQMLEWVQKGWINGYPDGTMRPNAPVTRAEYMALINRAFDFQEKGTVLFNDISVGNWQYDVISRAVQAGYVSGYADGSIHPAQQVSRQEAAVMLTRNLQLAPVKSQLKPFKDASRIAKWSLEAVTSLVANKLLSGYEDSTFRPEQSITRAEAVVLIGRGIHVRTINYAKSGIYGPDKGLATVTGNVVIQVTNVTLKNMTIDGDLQFAEGIGSGDAYLKNVIVRGKTTVNGGGSHSIHLEDSTLESITVNKKDGDVRIVAEGTTTSKEVQVESSALIEQSNVTKGGFSSIKLSDQLPPDSKIALKGSFENVDVDGKQIALDISGGSIGKLNVADKALGTSINLDKESKIVELKLDAEVKTTGEGKIEKATVSEQAKNSSLSTKPDVVEGNGAAGIKIDSPNPKPVPDNGSITFPPPFIPPGNSNPGTPPTNNVPTGSVPIQQFLSGTEPKVIHLANFFSDSDSDAITFSNASAANTSIATVQLSNSNLTITEVGTGNTTISFKYTDGKETPISASFTLNINASITGASAINSKVIEVTLNHPNLHVDLSQFTVTDAAYNSIAIESVKLAPYDKIAQTVLLKLSSNPTAGTLYKVKSSSSMSTFVGMATDVTKPTMSSAVESTYHEVVLTFSEPIELDMDNFAIHQVYGSQSTINIYSAELIEKNKIKLLTSNLKSTNLYKLTVSGVVDYAQQTIDLMSLTFIGNGLEQSNMNSNAKVISGNRVYVDLETEFDAAQLSFADIGVSKGSQQYLSPASVSAATYQDAVDYGYINLPVSDVQAAAKKGIIITLGDTLVNGALYTVSISMLADRLGGFHTASANFLGIYTATVPTIQASIAVDAQTLKIYFDRSVDDINIDGANKLYNSSIVYSSADGSAFVLAGRTNLITNGLVVQTKLRNIDISTIPGTYAYKDPTNGHVLVVNVPTISFFKNTNAAPTPGTFKLIVDSNKVVNTASANIIEFAPSAIEPSAVRVDVIASSSNRIRVYFSKAVQFGTINNFAQIAAVSGNVYGNGANIAISNPIATDSTKREYEFNVAVPFTDTSLKYLVFNPSLEVADFSDLGHIIGLSPNQSSLTFAGNPS